MKQYITMAIVALVVILVWEFGVKKFILKSEFEEDYDDDEY